MRVVIATGIVLGLCGCDKIVGTDARSRAEVTKARIEQVRSECASRLTYDRLKEYVFDEAARIRNSDPRRLDQLAAYSVARMDDPVVKSRDDRLNITVCSGQFVLNLPPGVQDAFDDQPLIKADVEYAAQSAADGSGLVYSMTGAEPIIFRLATLGLPSRPMPQIVAAPAGAGEEKITEPDVSTADRQVALPPLPSTATTPKETRSVARKPPTQRKSEPSREVKAGGSPSFKCKYAKTRSEKLVCSSGRLAAADRRMSAFYYSKMAGASGQAKRELRRTRDRFLARRERCASESCVARVYEERVAEISRIGGK